jgi:hypothetical protein
MVVSVWMGYGSEEPQKLGTVSSDGKKLKFDVDERTLSLLKGYPEKNPDKFIENLMMRFSYSSTISIRKEEG